MEEKLLHSWQRKESDMFERINNHIICRCSLIDKCNCSDESALLTNVEQVVFIFSCFLIEIKSSFQEYQWEITGSRHLLKTLTGFFLYFLTFNNDENNQQFKSLRCKNSWLQETPAARKPAD